MDRIIVSFNKNMHRKDIGVFCVEWGSFIQSKVPESSLFHRYILPFNSIYSLVLMGVLWVGWVFINNIYVMSIILHRCAFHSILLLFSVLIDQVSFKQICSKRFCIGVWRIFDFSTSSFNSIRFLIVFQETSSLRKKIKTII